MRRKTVSSLFESTVDCQLKMFGPIMFYVNLFDQDPRQRPKTQDQDPRPKPKTNTQDQDLRPRPKAKTQDQDPTPRPKN